MPTYVAAPGGTVVRRSDGQIQYIGGGAPLPGDVTGAQLTELVANGRVTDSTDAVVDPTPTPDPGTTFSTAQQASLAGTFAPIDARDTSISTFVVGMLVASGSTLYKVTTAHAAPFDSAKATSVGGGGGGGSGDMLAANNLSDVANAATARTNLGLGNVNNTSDANKPVSTAQQAAIDAAAAAMLGRNTQTGTTYTAVLADAGKVIRTTNASAVTVTIPPNSSVAYPTDTIINVYAAGAAGTTIAAGGGVTIRNNAAALVQYAECSLRKDATDEWVRLG